MTVDERDMLAAEFVLGTLDGDEARDAAALVESDPAFAALVLDWEARLSPLSDGVKPVVPKAEVWQRIEAALDRAAPGGVLSVAADAEADDVPEVDLRERLADSAGPADVIDLSRRLSRWRAFAIGATAAAAALAAVAVIDRLPAPSQGTTGRYVAVVNADGSLPALIVDVDTAAGQVTVRSIAAERPADRDLELWAIPEGGTPVSLGIVDPSDPVLRIKPDRAGVIPTRGAFAVSVEPTGGSPTGAPTGPVLYSGVLVPAGE